MECVYTFGIDRHKRQVDITLLFEYSHKDIYGKCETEIITVDFHIPQFFSYDKDKCIFFNVSLLNLHFSLE